MSLAPSPSEDPEKLVARLKRQLKCLCDLGFVLESTMSLDEVLSRIVRQTDFLMGAERSTLFTVTEDGSLVSRIIEAGEIEEIRLEPGQGVAGWVARSGLPLNVPDVTVDERFDPLWDSRSGFVTRSLLCHPITSQSGDIIGVIEVLNKKAGAAFGQEDLDLLRLIAGQLALIIENSTLMIDLVEKNRALIDAKRSLERSNRELDLLLDLERKVARSEDLDSLITSLIERVLTITRAEVGVMYRTDDTGAELRVAYADGTGNRVIRFSQGTGIAAWVAAKGREVNLTSPTADPRFAENVKDRIGVVPEHAAAVPVLSEKGGPPYGSLLVANKKMADAFSEADMALLRMVATRLAQAIEDISTREERERERRLATVGRLLAGVLHDLKSPISVVSGYAQLLAEKAGPPESEEYLSHLNQALDRITVMAEEIISFTRGERRLLLSGVLVEEVMEELLREIRPLLAAHNINLVTRIRGAGSLKLDREKILRVFHNIVRNAVEAMSGQGELTVEVEQIDDKVVFAFTDTGPGIPVEIQGSVFQSFVSSGKVQGTGLGLSVAREIVQAHGGTIRFATVPGSGTTFIVSIPSR